MYRLYFEPVILECDNADAARKAGEKASCQGVPLKVSDHVDRVRSLVSITDYPYVCGSCSEHVAPTDEGRCGFCDATNWKKRTS